MTSDVGVECEEPPSVDWDLVLQAWEPLAQDAGVGEWIVSPGVMPAFVFSEEMEAFYRALSEAGVMVPFDWGAWMDAVGRSVEETPGALDGADAETLRRLLVAHVRTDRFSEGHLAAVIGNGLIGRILDRARELASR